MRITKKQNKIYFFGRPKINLINSDMYKINP